MFEDGVHSFFCAVDHVDHALRETNLLDEFENKLHRGRNFFGRLDDVGVASRQRIGQIPKRNHAWKIERRNRGTHTNGLANHNLVNARGDIFNELALAHVRHPASNFDVLEGTYHFGFGFFKRFAAFIGDELGNLIMIGTHEVTQFEEILHTIIDRHTSP